MSPASGRRSSPRCRRSPSARARSTSARASPTRTARRRCSRPPSAAMRAGHNQYAPLPGVPALREAIAEHQRRCYGLEPEDDPGHVRRDRGDRRGAARAVRSRRRGGRARPVLRLLRAPASRWPARAASPVPLRAAGLGARRGRSCAAAITPAHARAAAQLAAQPDRPRARPRRARGDRRGVRRARPDRDHRRGLRAPRVRRRAHPARDAAGDGRAHADDLVASARRSRSPAGRSAGRAGRPSWWRRRAAPSSS